MGTSILKINDKLSFYKEFNAHAIRKIVDQFIILSVYF